MATVGQFLNKQKQEKTVKLYSLHFSEERDRYIMSVDKILESEVPDMAVHVTGERGAFLIDYTGYVRPKLQPDTVKPSAVDLNLYLLNNDINDALALSWRGGMGDIDWKKWIVIAIVGVIGCACMLTFWPY